ncbi:MAG: hypothetical protein Tsb0010_07720 [Parvularculaceae bacterium]
MDRKTSVQRMKCLAAGALCSGLFAASANAGQGADAAPPLQDRTIGYVLTYLYWSIYQSEDASQDCPQGFNSGPRQQYEALFPADGPTPTVTQAQLWMEGETWNPTPGPDPFPFYEPQTKYALGLNLDGIAGPEDFVSPDGEEGIDNQLYRTLGCIIGFRGPDGVEYIFEAKAIKDRRYNRLMLELTDVDSLDNDPEVKIAVYRGLDRLLTDASGDKVVPGGSQRIDTRWGKDLIRHIDGRIVDGVLTTDPIPDLIIPWMNLSVPTFQQVRDMRLRLKLSEKGAEGLIAGYVDVETWYRQLLRNDATHHLSNGDISALSLYKNLYRLADAYPDPETGQNTAISASLNAEFVQVHIIHPDEDEDPESTADTN